MADAVLYTTLEGEGEAEFTEKRSVFIGHASPVKSEEEAMAYIKKQKSAYADARHNVWAYLGKGARGNACRNDLRRRCGIRLRTVCKER